MIALFSGKRRLDLSMLFAVCILVATGLVFVYSASCYSAKNDTGSPYFFLIKQATGAAVGALFMAICAKIPLSFVKKLWIIAPIAAAVLLALVFVPGIGVENYGAKRWIGFGGFSMQPSEIAKFAFVVFAAAYMSRIPSEKFRFFLPVIAVGGVFCLLIIAEPNMSVTVCMGLLLLVMLYVGGMKGKSFLLLAIPIFAAVPVLIFAEPYRVQRLLAFLDPWASPKAEGYQLIQSLYALGSGGWFGVGLFNSRQKYEFLPFAESDFVFSVIGEETGLVGCTLLFVLFLLVIYRGVVTAANCREKFTCYLSAGITAVIAVQSAINFAVVTGSIPPTGLPLPFISYGGTSLVVFMAASGLLLNCSKNG